jgi:hypothetical protein
LTEKIKAIMEELLPEAKVYHQIRDLLLETEGVVGLESGDIVVPADAALTIIFRRVQVGPPEQAFTSVLVAMVAVGGIERVDPVPKAKYCFFRLFFNYDGSLITCDVMESLDS